MQPSPLLGGIGGEGDSQPFAPLANAFADRRGRFADAGGEDQTVDPPHTGCHCGDRLGGSVDEQINRLCRLQPVGFQQVAHVAAVSAGDAEQAGFVVEQVVQGFPVGALLEQEQDDAGIDAAAARSHWQPVERGESHGAVNADAITHGTQAGATAEMGDHHTAACQPRCALLQRSGDIFVRQAVEAVSPDAGIMQCARQGEAAGDVSVAAVEGGIEAGHLRQVRVRRGQRADRSQIVRLVQRGERNQPLQIPHDGLVDQHRRGEAGAAMDDAMPGCDQFGTGGIFPDPGREATEQGFLCAVGVPPVGVGHSLAGSVPHVEVRQVANAGNLTLQGCLAVDFGCRPDRELDAGRPSIDDEDGVFHVTALRPRVLRWRTRPGGF